MNRDTATIAVIGGIVGIGLGAALFFLALGGAGVTRSTISMGTPISIPMPPDDGSVGVIFDLRKTGGHRFLGITFKPPTYEAHVAMAVPDQCLATDEGGQVTLSSEGECASLPAHGELSGNGSLPSGKPLAIVRIEVSKSCYETLVVGDDWPSNLLVCAPDKP